MKAWGILKDFFMGAAHVLDISGSFGPRITDFPSDEEAISSDWAAVGQDMKIAMGKFDKGMKN